jgi:uncharacterized integral membrane protein
MADAELRFDMTFADFRRLQAHMGRRVYRRNRGAYTVALAGVVLCAVFLTFAILVNLHPGIAYRLFGDWGYPLAIYVAILLCLVAAILALMPAVKLRFRTLRLRVTDDGPFLGATRIAVEPDGLLVERPTLRAKYLWAAFRGIETAGRAIVLPIDEGIGLIIPESAFPSEAARREFVAEVAARVEAGRVGSEGQA